MMTAREFSMACDKFNQFGKIKDIDFSDELCYEPLGGDDDMSYKLDASGELIIKSIDFEEGEVVLGELVNFGCECCGSYYQNSCYDLDELYEKGYLDLVLDRLEEVLNKKMELRGIV